MISTLETVSPPAATIPVAVAATHLRLDNDQSLVDIYVAAATSWAEAFTGRALMPQVLRWTVASAAPPGGWPMTAFPLQLLVLPQWFSPSQIGARPLILPRQPVLSVGPVTLGGWGRTNRVLQASEYQSDIGSGRLNLAGIGALGPGERLTVEFSAGYANAGAIPPAIRQAILLLTTFFYEHRGDDDGAEPPAAVKMLLNPYRLVTFG